MKELYIVRGVSGAGKSTVADALSENSLWPVCEADSYHYQNGDYNWKVENQAAAHSWCKEKVRGAMSYGFDRIIVSNTNTSLKEIQPYIDMAEEFGYSVFSLVIENRHGNNSVHRVPQETRDAQERRLRNSLKLQ